MYLVSDYSNNLTFVASVDGNDLYVYKPTFLRPLLISFEKLSFVRKTRLRLELIRGGYMVYYLAVDGFIIGYNIIAPGGRRLKCSTQNDIVVGPLYVDPKCRGKGYSTVLMKLPLLYSPYEYERAFDWIAESNIPSIKASKACGFKEYGRLTIKGFFRRLVEDENGDDIIFCYSRIIENLDNSK